MAGLDEMRAALGPPLRAVAGDALQAGRWRHRDVDDTLPCDGSVRLIVPLSETHRVWHRKRRGTLRLPVRIGTPATLDPDRELRAIVEGELDILAVSLSGWAALEPDALALAPSPDPLGQRARWARLMMDAAAEVGMDEAFLRPYARFVDAITRSVRENSHLDMPTMRAQLGLAPGEDMRPLRPDG